MGPEKSDKYSKLDLSNLMEEDKRRNPVMSRKTLDGVMLRISEHPELSLVNPSERERYHCYDLAARITEIINDRSTHWNRQSYYCSKIVAYGERAMNPKSRDKPDWTNHLAVLIKLAVENCQYPQHWVIDLMISRDPIPLDEWIGRLTDLSKCDVRQDVSLEENILSFLVFPSFFLKPKFNSNTGFFSGNLTYITKPKEADYINKSRMI